MTRQITKRSRNVTRHATVAHHQGHPRPQGVAPELWIKRPHRQPVSLAWRIVAVQAGPAHQVRNQQVDITITINVTAGDATADLVARNERPDRLVQPREAATAVIQIEQVGFGRVFQGGG